METRRRRQQFEQLNLIFVLFQNGVELVPSTATRMAHLEGRLVRPIPAQALMRAVEITIVLARVACLRRAHLSSNTSVEHLLARLIVAPVPLALAS